MFFAIMLEFALIFIAFKFVLVIVYAINKELKALLYMVAAIFAEFMDILIKLVQTILSRKLMPASSLATLMSKALISTSVSRTFSSTLPTLF